MDSKPPTQVSKRELLSTVDTALSLIQWAWDRISPYTLPFAVGAVMTYFAAVTDWLNDWGPVAWGSVGVVALVATLLSHGAWTRWRGEGAQKRTQARILDRFSESYTINPLQEQFSNVQIDVHDLRTLDGSPLKKRFFNECVLAGPSLIILSGCNITEGFRHMANVQFIELPLERIKIVPNKQIWEKCTLRNCDIFNIVFAVNSHDANLLRERMSADLWLN